MTRIERRASQCESTQRPSSLRQATRTERIADPAPVPPGVFTPLLCCWMLRVGLLRALPLHRQMLADRFHPRDPLRKLYGALALGRAVHNAA